MSTSFPVKLRGFQFVKLHTMTLYQKLNSLPIFQIFFCQFLFNFVYGQTFMYTLKFIPYYKMVLYKISCGVLFLFTDSPRRRWRKAIQKVLKKPAVESYERNVYTKKVSFKKNLALVSKSVFASLFFSQLFQKFQKQQSEVFCRKRSS